MEAGRAPESAGRIAADTLVNSKYYYLETYRVPRDRDVTAIQAHTDAILKKKQDGATGIDPDPMQWRNTPDGGGLMLVDATGGQINDKDGEAIRATFEEAEAKGLEPLGNNFKDPNDAYLRGPDGSPIRLTFNGDESELLNALTDGSEISGLSPSNSESLNHDLTTADPAAIKEAEQEFFALWEQLGLPQSDLSDFMAASDDNAEVVRRFKRIATGALSGAGLETALKGASTLRTLHRTSLLASAAPDEDAGLTIIGSDQGSLSSAKEETQPKLAELASGGSNSFSIISDAEATPALIPVVAGVVFAAVRLGARYLLPRLNQAARARLGLTLRQRATQIYRASEKPKVEASMEELFGSGVSEGDAMAAFAEQTLEGNLTPDKAINAFEMTFRPVNDAWAARVKKETGYDFSGYIKSVETDNLRHSHNRHGVGNERDRRQQAVALKDYALVPVVVEDFDDGSVEYRPAKGGKAATLLLKKRFNGTFYVVQFARGKAQRLTFKSMWIKKSGAK